MISLCRTEVSFVLFCFNTEVTIVPEGLNKGRVLRCSPQRSALHGKNYILFAHDTCVTVIIVDKLPSTFSDVPCESYPFSGHLILFSFICSKSFSWLNFLIEHLWFEFMLAFH